MHIFCCMGLAVPRSPVLYWVAGDGDRDGRQNSARDVESLRTSARTQRGDANDPASCLVRGNYRWIYPRLRLHTTIPVGPISNQSPPPPFLCLVSHSRISHSRFVNAILTPRKPPSSVA